MPRREVWRQRQPADMPGPPPVWCSAAVRVAVSGQPSEADMTACVAGLPPHHRAGYTVAGPPTQGAGWRMLAGGLAEQEAAALSP